MRRNEPKRDEPKRDTRNSPCDNPETIVGSRQLSDSDLAK